MESLMPKRTNDYTDKDGNETRMVAARVPTDLFNKINKQAESNYRNKSQEVRRLIELGLKVDNAE